MFDTMIIGQVCLDTNIDYDGREEHRFGGAVLFSGHAAYNIGNNVAVVPKSTPRTSTTPKRLPTARASRCSRVTQGEHAHAEHLLHARP